MKRKIYGLAARLLLRLPARWSGSPRLLAVIMWLTFRALDQRRREQLAGRMDR